MASASAASSLNGWHVVVSVLVNVVHRVDLVLVVHVVVELGHVDSYVYTEIIIEQKNYKSI
jgi:hypothetical protein